MTRKLLAIAASVAVLTYVGGAMFFSVWAPLSWGGWV